MFTLVTGLPGSGKSLNTIKTVELERIRPDGSKRAVYYWGIPELKLDWIPLHAADSTPEDARARYDKGLSVARPEDAFEWFNVPPESIVVIDEAQYIFPKLSQKSASAPPERYKQLAIHRHSGTDLYCMSQHPSLLALEARRQVQRYWHLERPYGLDYINRYAWEKCVSPDDRSERNKAAVSKISIDSKFFGVYKSAEVHTVKKRLPWKQLLTLAVAIVAIVGLGWFAASKLADIGEPDSVPLVEGEAPTLEKRSDKKAAINWESASVVPRVPHWLWSAPLYDGHAEIVSVPRIRGCMSMQIGSVRTCSCSNGQGRAQVPAEVCHAYMAGLVFDPTAPVADAKAENVARLDASSSASTSTDSGSQAQPSAPSYRSTRGT